MTPTEVEKTLKLLKACEQKSYYFVRRVEEIGFDKAYIEVVQITMPRSEQSPTFVHRYNEGEFDAYDVVVIVDSLCESTGVVITDRFEMYRMNRERFLEVYSPTLIKNLAHKLLRGEVV